MKYAVIAAGNGTRLAEEGVECPKPLVRVGNECLLDRLVRIFSLNGAQSVAVICNDKWPQVVRHVENMGKGRVPIHCVVENTPSSMHSLYALRQTIAQGPFCLTTVDTVFSEARFEEYINAFTSMTEKDEVDALMGVTTFIDDEKPLFVDVDEEWNIRAFLDSSQNPQYVSAGIYGLTTAVWQVLEECIQRGEQRMRNFQRALIEKNLRVKAFLFDKVIDVDHQADVIMAQQFVKGTS